MQSGDNMASNVAILEEDSIRSKIHMIRGQQVMLDRDLAEIYGYETKRFNEQVKNNIERFDDDFRFQLTDEEIYNLRSKISTSSWGGSGYLPNGYKNHCKNPKKVYTMSIGSKGNVAGGKAA